jgi:hypothetical protein
VNVKNVAKLALCNLALALVVGIIPLLAACGVGDEGASVRDPEVSGTRLAAFQQPVPDDAAGQPAPEVHGTAFDGTDVSITNDGRTKALVFLAHW